MTDGKEEVNIAYGTLKRKHEDPDCDFAGYQRDGGNKLCTVFIAVECGDDVDVCAFELSMKLYEAIKFDDIEPDEVPESSYPPKYIPDDVDYVDGILEGLGS